MEYCSRITIDILEIILFLAKQKKLAYPLDTSVPVSPQEFLLLEENHLQSFRLPKTLPEF